MGMKMSSIIKGFASTSEFLKQLVGDLFSRRGQGELVGPCRGRCVTERRQWRPL